MFKLIRWVCYALSELHMDYVPWNQPAIEFHHQIKLDDLYLQSRTCDVTRNSGICCLYCRDHFDVHMVLSWPILSTQYLLHYMDSRSPPAHDERVASFQSKYFPSWTCVLLSSWVQPMGAICLEEALVVSGQKTCRLMQVSWLRGSWDFTLCLSAGVPLEGTIADSNNAVIIWIFPFDHLFIPRLTTSA